MRLAFALQQRLVLDNTNVTKSERSSYITQAKAVKYMVTGYYFESNLSACLLRNEKRLGKEKIENVGVISKYKALELPSYDEGFDDLYYVKIENDQFIIKDWSNEI